MMNVDSEVLISLVEERPVLWDNTLPSYKDRITTVCAWADVCRAFKTDFDELPKRDQSECVKLVVKKWTCIRDSWMKCIKKTQYHKRSANNGKKPRPYLYSAQLSFLKKLSIRSYAAPRSLSRRRNSEIIEVIDLKCKSEVDPINIDEILTPKSSRPDRQAFGNVEDVTISNTSRSNQHNAERSNPLEEKMCKLLDCMQTQTSNRHMSFFQSIQPSLETLVEDEVIEFQMGVLKLIKDIKKNRTPSYSFESA